MPLNEEQCMQLKGQNPVISIERSCKESFIRSPLAEIKQLLIFYITAYKHVHFIKISKEGFCMYAYYTIKSFVVKRKKIA